MPARGKPGWMATVDGDRCDSPVVLGVSTSYAHACHLCCEEALAMWEEQDPDNTVFDFLALAGFIGHMSNLARDDFKYDHFNTEYADCFWTVEVVTVYGL